MSGCGCVCNCWCLNLHGGEGRRWWWWRMVSVGCWWWCRSCWFAPGKWTWWYLKPHTSLDSWELLPRGFSSHDDSSTPCPSSERVCVCVWQPGSTASSSSSCIQGWNYSQLICHQEERGAVLSGFYVAIMLHLLWIAYRLRKGSFILLK